LHFFFIGFDDVARYERTGTNTDALSNAVQKHDDREGVTDGSQRFNPQTSQEKRVCEVENHHPNHTKEHRPCKGNELLAYTSLRQISVQIAHKKAGFLKFKFARYKNLWKAQNDGW